LSDKSARHSELLIVTLRIAPTQLEAMRNQVDAIAADLHATSVLPLTGAVNPDQPVERGGRAPAILAKPRPAGPGEPGAVMYSASEALPLFVATPELLAHMPPVPSRPGIPVRVRVAEPRRPAW
jgi:hypothetical protein